METIYQNGTYNRNNPGWHTDDSPWKTKQILKLINRQNIKPRTVCDVGCGTGEILEQLCSNMPGTTKYYGYEISQLAYELCKKRTNPQIDFF